MASLYGKAFPSPSAHPVLENGVSLRRDWKTSRLFSDELPKRTMLEMQSLRRGLM